MIHSFVTKGLESSTTNIKNIKLFYLVYLGYDKEKDEGNQLEENEHSVFRRESILIG